MQYGLVPVRYSALSDRLLRDCVLLSLLLHVFFIVLFGDAAGGGARRGEKMWGALTVTVQGMLPNRDDGPGLKIDRGAIAVPRSENADRPAPAPADTTVQTRDARELTPADVAQPAEADAPPVQAPSIEMPRLLSKEVEKAVTDFVVPKPSADRAFVPPFQTPPIEPPPVVTTPVVAAPPQEPLAPIKISPMLTAPLMPLNQMEIKAREEPVAPPAPKPEPPRPNIEREVVKPVVPAPEPKPREILTPAVQTPLPAPTIPAPSITPPVAAPVTPAPREIPPAPTPAPALSEPPPRAEAAKPAKIEPDVMTPVAPPTAAKAAPPRPPAGVPSGSPTGTPNADTDLFKPQGDSATAAPGKSPGIDLDAVRKRARELSGAGAGRSVFPFPVAPPPKPKSKEQQAFDKALKKNDCRDAYADMGLAAVVPLVLDSVRENGCKW